MAHNEFPTANADAMSNYVQGRALFARYLESGSGDALKQARDHFAKAADSDPNFDIAKLYLATTQTELRDTKDSIPVLEDLIRNRKYLPEAHFQLAYAHIKQYKHEDYLAAGDELAEAEQAAKIGDRGELIDLIEAYRVFLFAVRGAYDTEFTPQERKEDLLKAIQDGGALLERASAPRYCHEDRASVLFEVNNALGIAYTWLGHWFPSDPEVPDWWKKSEKCLISALTLRPKSARVLENLGALYMAQGDWVAQRAGAVPPASRQELPDDARKLYGQAMKYVEQALELNPFDQYPHFQKANLSARLDDWITAQKSRDEGRNQFGAVSDTSWNKLDEAIRAQDASQLWEPLSP